MLSDLVAMPLAPTALPRNLRKPIVRLKIPTVPSPDIRAAGPPRRCNVSPSTWASNGTCLPRVVHAGLDDPDRNPGNHVVGPHVQQHDRSGGDDRAFADFYRWRTTARTLGFIDTFAVGSALIASARNDVVSWLRHRQTTPGPRPIIFEIQ